MADWQQRIGRGCSSEPQIYVARRPAHRPTPPRSNFPHCDCNYRFFWYFHCVLMSVPHITRRLVIGADHGAFELKSQVVALLKSLGFDVLDVGCHSSDSVDYPDVAHDLCTRIQTGEYPQGILMCGTGIGISIAANKHRGIRCGLAHDAYTARMAKEHNDANVLAFGARTEGAGIEHAREMITAWLEAESPATDSRHGRRVRKLETTTLL